MNEDKIKHLEFIQGIITRMNTNSFQLKGWVIVLVSALLALYANSLNTVYIFVSIFPTILFWALDSYYLQQERKFRGVYDIVAGIKKGDFEIKTFEMPIQKFKDGKYSYCSVFWSNTIAWFYGTISLLLLIGGLILTLIKNCK